MYELTLPPLENNDRDPANPPAMPFWQMKNAPDGRSAIEQQMLGGLLAAQRQRRHSGDLDAAISRKGEGSLV